MELINAVIRRNLKEVKAFFDAKDSKPEVNFKDCKEKKTALIYASIVRATDIVRYLLVDLKADPNIEDKARDTALIHACIQGSSEIVQLLIDNGADVTVKNNGSRTALIYNSKYNNNLSTQDTIFASLLEAIRSKAKDQKQFREFLDHEDEYNDSAEKYARYFGFIEYADKIQNAQFVEQLRTKIEINK